MVAGEIGEIIRMGRADEGVEEEGFCGYGAGGGVRGFVRIVGFESSPKQSQKRAMEEFMVGFPFS